MRAYMPVLLAAILSLFLMGCQNPMTEFTQADTTVSLATPPGYRPATPIGQVTWQDKANAALALAEEEAPPVVTAQSAPTVTTKTVTPPAPIVVAKKPLAKVS